jgi:hypothetical protein
MSVDGHSAVTEYIDSDGTVADRDELEDFYLTLTQETLPRKAKNSDWPVRFDHCFQRICYDNAYGDVWYEFVDGSPAYQTIPDGALLKATAIAYQMMMWGKPAIERLNQKSLYWRDEIPVWDVTRCDVEDL